VQRRIPCEHGSHADAIANRYDDLSGVGWGLRRKSLPDHDGGSSNR
jgi:hypothetical protein